MSVFDILKRLTEAKIHFSLAAHQEDAIMFLVAVPGERWEIEVSKDGRVDVEVFRSTGDVTDQTALNDLFERFSD